jgi:FkbM family methyltransferase
MNLHSRIKIIDKEFILFSDDDYLLEVGSEFEPKMTELFQLLINSSDNVLDIGANIGCTTLLFSQIASKVDAFEPCATTFAFLEKNIKLSGRKNISLHNVGLGKFDEKLTLTYAKDYRAGGFISNKTQANADHLIEDVQIKIGDSFVKEKINFIKVDVEGFEIDVIEGLQDTLQLNRPVVVLELNHWCLNALQRTSVPDFFDFLLKTFPIVLAIDGRHYSDLKDASNRYNVMHHHILNFRYPNIVCAYCINQVQGIYDNFSLNMHDDKSLTQEQNIDAVTQERDILIQKLDSLVNSVSWRVTRPLRFVKRIYKLCIK